MNKPAIRILLVDDESAIRRALPAGEVIRLRAMLDAMRLPSEVQPMMGIPPEGWKP